MTMHIRWVIALFITLIYIILLIWAYLENTEDDCYFEGALMLLRGSVITNLYAIFWIIWLLIFK